MKKPICLILSLVLLMSFAACGETQNAETTTEPSATEPVAEELRSNVVETDPQTGESYYLMADFESYYECSQVKYAGDFGKVDMISAASQPDMVTYGEGSIHFTISGNSDFQRKFKPHIRFSTVGEFFNLTTDFSDMDRFSFDIYNCQDHVSQIRIAMDAEINPRFTYPDLTFTNANNPNTTVYVMELTPGWNHVEVPAELFKAQSYDSSGSLVMLSGADALAAVGAFCIFFDRGELHETPEEFYLDNVRAYLVN